MGLTHPPRNSENDLPSILEDWLKEKISEHRWIGVREARSLTHEWCKHTGGRTMRAKLRASIEPAEHFSIQAPTDSQCVAYVAAVRNAAVSVLLSHSYAPILKCKLTFDLFVIDDLESCYAAFYEVAHEATRRLLGLTAGFAHNIQN
jgi:hypothetical protein